MTETTTPGRNGGVYLVSAARTPIGKFGGAMAAVPAVELGGVAIRAAIERSGLPDGAPVDEVLMGQVIQAGAGQAPARQAALLGGLPVTTSATTMTGTRMRRTNSSPPAARVPINSIVRPTPSSAPCSRRLPATSAHS